MQPHVGGRRPGMGFPPGYMPTAGRGFQNRPPPPAQNSLMNKNSFSSSGSFGGGFPSGMGGSSFLMGGNGGGLYGSMGPPGSGGPVGMFRPGSGVPPSMSAASLPPPAFNIGNPGGKSFDNTRFSPMMQNRPTFGSLMGYAPHYSRTGSSLGRGGVSQFTDMGRPFMNYKPGQGGTGGGGPLASPPSLMPFGDNSNRSSYMSGSMGGSQMMPRSSPGLGGGGTGNKNVSWKTPEATRQIYHT